MSDTPPISEQELYERAFGNLSTFPSDNSRESVARYSMLEHGRAGLATALLAIGMTEDLSDYSKAILRDIYVALSDAPVRGDFVLEIQQRRPGHRKTSDEAHEVEVEDELIATLVSFGMQKYRKKEAAVASIAGLMKVSRASIFRSLKRHADRLSQTSG